MLFDISIRTGMVWKLQAENNHTPHLRLEYFRCQYQIATEHRQIEWNAQARTQIDFHSNAYYFHFPNVHWMINSGCKRDLLALWFTFIYSLCFELLNDCERFRMLFTMADKKSKIMTYFNILQVTKWCVHDTDEEEESFEYSSEQNVTCLKTRLFHFIFPLSSYSIW